MDVAEEGGLESASRPYVSAALRGRRVRIGALLAAWGRPRATDIGVLLKDSSQQALKTY